MIAILIGVTGTGKSTVAKAFADRTGWTFAEGDDYHPAANKQKMHAGIPLTDEDRAPWLAALHEVVEQWAAAGTNGVLTCSALKQSYRDILRGDLSPAVVRFVLLDVPKAVLVERLAHRQHEFMNPALLDSQLATLEQPTDALRIDASGTTASAVDQIIHGLGIHG